MFIILNKSAKARGRARNYGPYRHLAVVEVADDFVGEPMAINSRSIKRVVYDTGCIYAGGTTPRSIWQQELARVTEMTAKLNDGEDA